MISPKIGSVMGWSLPLTGQVDSLLKDPGLTTCFTCRVVMGEFSSDEESTGLSLLALGRALDWLIWRDRLARRRTFRVSQGTPCCFEVSFMFMGHIEALE